MFTNNSRSKVPLMLGPAFWSLLSAAESVSSAGV